MASFDYNPITGQLDLVGSGGGSYIDGEVEYHSNLPVTVGTPAVNSAFLVRKGEGLYFISRKPAGIWVRELNNGNLDDWKYAGTFSDLYRDANFRIINDADTSKELAFSLSGITTGTTRTLTAPDASGTIARTEDFAAPPAIGNTTPAAATFTTLTAQGDGANVLVATFGAADAISNEIQIWGNGAGRNQVLRASGASGIDFRMATGGAHCGLITNGTPTGFRMSANSAYGWSNNVSNSLAGTPDTFIFRDAADTVAQRRTTNPQTFRLYNTFTDASNYERGFMRWSSNVLQIGTEKAGTGSARALEFQVDGTTRVSINTSGTVSANAGVDVNTDARLANGFGLTIAQNRGVFWTDGTTNSGTRDVFLGRFAARQLALRLGASDPMAFQIYNAYTSTTNFERLNLRWDSNQFIIDAEAGSAGGTLRGIKIGSATSSLLGFYGVTPVDQPATVADPAGGGTIDTEARTAIGEVIDRLQELGLIA